MIVGEYQGCGIQLQGSPDDYPGVDAGTIDSAPEEFLESYEAVLAVQEHAAEVLVFLACNMELAELPDV
jgi:hypothetical protein